MSAYVVEDVTINRVLSYLFGSPELRNRADTIIRNGKTGARPESDGPAGLQGLMATERLGRLLRALNVQAVSERYGDDKGDRAAPYRYRPEPSGPVQAYKSLRCYLCQCSEGDIPQSPLYRAMDAIADLIAAHIVTNGPEYQAADWG